MSLLLSIVIPSFNRRASLARTMAALSRQTLSAGQFEVVVVDDGSSDGTTDWLRAQQFPFQLQALRQENAGPARARNVGVEKARAPLIVFLDDDVEPLPTLLEEHLRAHGDETDLAVLGTLGTLPRYPEPWVAWEQIQLEKQYRWMSSEKNQATYRQFWTGNASVARRHVLDAGGFDQSFLRAEDVELGLRMHKRGVRYRFNPRARTMHHARRTLRGWCEMHRSYGRLEVAIFDRDSNAELVLGGNWGRLRPGVRAFIERSNETPGGHAAVRKTMETFLEACAATGLHRPAFPVCSVLANLVFWEAAGRALGPEREARMRALVRKPDQSQ